MPRLGVCGLTDEKLFNVSFEVGPGEIFGIAGLAGSGRTRLLHLLFGARPPTAGEIRIDDQVRSFHSPSDALSAGVGLVSEDRQEDGFVQTMPIWQNVTLPWVAHFVRRGLLRRRKERIAAETATKRLDVRMPSLDAMMSELSGGNQQKVIFGRWTSAPLRVLLLDEPTHGVDVRSKKEIYDIIRRLAAQQVAIVVVSSEFEEIEALCDRVLLLREGQTIGELRGQEVVKESILHALLSGGRRAVA